MFDMKKVAAVCAVAAFAFSGCGKSEKKETAETTAPVINEVDSNYVAEEEQSTAPPETATAAGIGQAAEDAEKTVSCELVELRKEGSEYEDTDTQMVIADVKITNNTSEELTPSVLSYFEVKNEDGSRCPGTTVRAQLTAARADEKAFFADGIKPGETVESDVYVEIPRNFEKLTFAYCPDTVDPSTGYAALSLITTFTPDDIKPAE